MKKIIMFFITLLAMVCLYFGLSYALMSKKGPENRERYYQQKEDVEVLFAGTSHAYAGYLPMELYREYGISAFNLSTAGERFAVTYYSLKDAFNYHVPKVLVIDCHAFEYGDEKNDPQVPTRCHSVFDGMPFSKLKIEAVKDVFSDNEDVWMEYFCPLYYYHNRWQELTKDDFIDPVKQCYAKGGRICEGAVIAPVPEVTEETDYVWEEGYSTEYARKIVELCRDYGVDVYFICIPFPCRVETQRTLNQAQRLADEYDNCTYISLLTRTDEMGFDYDTDMADEGSHVNPSGGRRITKYIGQYLSEKYDFTDYRSDDKESVWNIAYRDYTIGYDEERKQELDYLGYMTQLYQPDYSFCIYVADMKEANKTGQLAKFLGQNMAGLSADAAEGSYYCSNLGETVEEYKDISADDERMPEEFRDEIAEGAIVSIMVRNNVTGEKVETVNYGAAGRM